MDVGMTALAVAFLTAVALGVVLCLFFCIFRFFMKLVLPIRCRKWTREVWIFFRVVFLTLAILIFLYATNRGVFRWFLTGGVVVACLLTDRLLGKRLSHIGDSLTERVRRIVFRCLAWVTAPLLELARMVVRVFVAVQRKICLRVTAFYDKLLLKYYDKKRRSCLLRMVREDLTGLLGGIN